MPCSLWRILSALLSRNPNTKAQMSENRQVTAATEEKKKFKTLTDMETTKTESRGNVN